MQVDQIVKGAVCGTFVILALRTVDGEKAGPRRVRSILVGAEK